MNIYDIWPYFGILGVLLLIFSFSPAFRFIDEPAGVRRISTLDGLRGFLALSVFLHHAVVTYAFLKEGQWLFPPYLLYNLLGQVSVAFFFMISGFLFWMKLIREQKRMDWIALYIGRLFRLAPVYLVAVFSMLLVVFSRTGFALHEPFGKIAGEIGTWLGLGFLGKPDINGYKHTTLILAGVTWSLHYEWIYYASLRLICFFAAPKRRLIFVLGGWGISAALTFFLRGALTTYIAFFFSGMLAATLIHDGFRPKIPPFLGGVAILACLTLVFLGFPEVHNGLCIFLMTLAFFIICLGNNLFGLLTTNAAQRLGHISYGVYLMQGIVLTVFYAFDPVKNFGLANDGQYWLTVMIAALILTLTAALLHAFIERPGIALGHTVTKAVERRLRRFSRRG